MTVNELIEELKALPGDSDFRAVVCEVDGFREYTKPIRIEAQIQRVVIDGTTAVIRASGWIE